MVEFGAIDIESNKYVLPKNALKTKKYVCGECNQKVIIRLPSEQ